MYNAGVQEQKNNGMMRSEITIIILVCTTKLDCGIHPGLTGMDALPYTDMIEADEIDLLLITQ